MEVRIIDFGYQPLELEIDAGTSVTWVNRDPVQHDADDQAGGGDSPLLSEGESFSRTFDSAGQFLVACSIHPFMQLTVTVR